MVVDLSAAAWAVLVLGAAVVGLSKAALPGAGSLAAALFAAVLPAKESTGALLALLIVGDVFAVYSYRSSANVAVLRRLAPPVLAGIVLGTAFLAVASDAVVKRVIGAILLAMAAVTLARRSRKSAARREGQAHALQSAVYGSLGGFTTMVANAAGPVMSLYFLTIRLNVQAFLGTSAWFFLAVNLVKVPFSVSLGLINPQSLLMNAVLAPVVILAGILGRRLAGRMKQEFFEKAVLVLTVLSAVNLLL